MYREKTTWVPLYALFAFLLWRSFGLRRTAWLLVAVALCLTVADQLAASLLKPWIGRLRPCVEPTVADHARILVGCGGKFSFPSNHATNHFALAMLLSLTWLRRQPVIWRLALFVWAGTISLAQVYVGKHYPADVLAGAALGCLVAWLAVLAYRRWVPEPQQI